MKDKITLFENGKDVEEGDKFVASIDSVEGHRRVTLTKIDPIRELAKALAEEYQRDRDSDLAEVGAQRQEEMRDSYD